MSVTRRVEFSWMFANLIHYARILGLDIIIDEVKRGREQAKWNATHCRVYINGSRCELPFAKHDRISHDFKPIGISDSEHLGGNAGDLYIIENGGISNDELLYQRLGSYWVSLDPVRNRWGGNFTGFKDMGHFERI